MTAVTECDSCVHVFKPAREAQPWAWMCMKHKRLGGYGFVVLGAWTGMPPYLLCRDVNSGACPLYEKAAPGQLKMEVA